MPVAIAVVDAVGQVLFANEAMRGLGMPAAEGDAPSRWRAFTASGAPLDPRDWPAARALRGDAVMPGLEMVHVGAAGGEARMRVSATPLRDASGQVLGATCVAEPIAAVPGGDDRDVFVSLARNSVEFIGMCDASFRPFFVNEAGLRLVGLDSLEQAIRTDVREFFFPEDHDFLFTQFFPNVERDGQAQVEVRFRHFKTGEPLWMMYNVIALTNPAGERVGYGTISRPNATDRERAESALSDSEARLLAALTELEATYQGAPVGLCVLDRQLRYVRVNDRLAEINGLPVGEHIGRTVREVVPALAGTIDGVAGQVFRTGQPVRDVELIGTTAADPDHEHVWIEQWYPLRNSGGDVIGISVVAEDVTGERAARQERERLLAEAQAARSALERSLGETTALMAASRELSQVLRLEDVLRALCRLARDLVGADGAVFVFAEGDSVHYAEEDAIGTLWKGQRFLAHECVSGWSISRRETMVIDDIYAHPQVPHEAYRQTFVRSLAISPVRRAEPLGALGVYWQTNHRPSAEQVQLLETLADVGAIAVQNAQLFHESEQSNRRKDEFLAMLAHELRNPLAPVMNAVEVLRALGTREPRLEHAHDIIHRQVLHMTRLIDDLLDVSRITRGRIELRQERLALTEVVEAAVEASRHLIERHEHTLALNAADGIWVHGDRARLVQVLTNLLTNAAKFTPAAGHIALRAVSDGVTAEIAVRDTGVGLTAGARERIFELFAQEDVSVERSQGGLGIGLTLAKRLVEMHGGSLEVRSEGAGKGAEFVVRLPALPGSQETRPEPVVTAPATNRQMRVLVVEDNDDAAESFQMLLELGGHAVEVARDGLQALRAIERFAPDIAFIDIGLPGIDGFGVAERVRSQGGPRPVLVALSGYGRDQDKQRAAAAGFDEHMTKPVDHQRVQALLAKYGAAILIRDGSRATH